MIAFNKLIAYCLHFRTQDSCSTRASGAEPDDLEGIEMILSPTWTEESPIRIKLWRSQSLTEKSASKLESANLKRELT